MFEPTLDQEFTEDEPARCTCLDLSMMPIAGVQLGDYVVSARGRGRVVIFQGATVGIAVFSLRRPPFRSTVYVPVDEVRVLRSAADMARDRAERAQRDAVLRQLSRPPDLDR